MAVYITDECTNMGACELECPHNAIYSGEDSWSYNDGTNLNGYVKKLDGNIVDANAKNKPLSDEFYYVVADKCTGCIGTYNEPQCMAVCAMDALHYIDDKIDKNEQLAKFDWLNNSKSLGPSYNEITNQENKTIIVDSVEENITDVTIDRPKEDSNKFIKWIKGIL